MSRIMSWLVLLSIISALCGREAHAHELTSNTARVGLRDGNITIHLRASAGSWVAPDELLDGTRIRLDGADVPLKIRSFPDHEAIIEAAVGAAIETDLGGHRHARLLSATLESTSSGWRGDTLEVLFPGELGPVLVTFVQPKTHQLSAGATVRFDVLTEPTGFVAGNESWVGWFLVLLVMAFGAGAAQRIVLPAGRALGTQLCGLTRARDSEIP